MDDLRMISVRNFEEDTISTITHLIDSSERISFGHKIGAGELIADIFLENGCKRLDLPPKSVVEIKYILRHDTFSRIAFMYKNAINSSKYSKFLIICKENLLEPNILKRANESGRLEILTIDNLKKKIQLDDTKCHVDTPSIDVIETAKDIVSANRITLFLGAGVSMDAQLPSWNMLLESLLAQENKVPFEWINDANTDAISRSLADSSIVTGRYIIEGYREAIKKQCNATFSEAEIDEKVKNAVSSRIRAVLYRNTKDSNNSELVKAIAVIASEENVKQIITYNYDDLIEAELNDTKNFISTYDETIDRFSGPKPIYHVHGYIPRNEELPGTPVLSEREYHKLYSRMHHWANVVQLNALYTSTCFFIGFSMTDPNQRRLLDLARNVDLGSIDAGKAEHYIFMRRQNLKGEAIKAVNDEHCKEIENMMFELGLNVIWFDEFKNLPKCLLYVFGKTKDKPKMRF